MMLFSKYYLLAILWFLMGRDADRASTPSALPVVAIPDLDVEKDELKLHPLEGKWYYEGKSFSGFAIIYHSNGAKAEEIGYLDGKKEGVTQKWFPDGTLQKESFYRDNRLEGGLKVWSPNPQCTLVVESNFVNGTRHGLQRRWFANGQLQRRTNFYLGQEEGLQQAWLENGKIYVNYEAKNGRTFGLRKANLCYELDDENIK